MSYAKVVAHSRLSTALSADVGVPTDSNVLTHRVNCIPIRNVLTHRVNCIPIRNVLTYRVNCILIAMCSHTE